MYALPPDRHRAASSAPPLDADAFERAYPRFCAERGVWPDERMLSIGGQGRTINLHRLHAAVRAEGGMDAVRAR